MKPLPEEVLADVRWVLEHVVRPTVTDGFAAEQVGLAINLLEHVRLRIMREPELLATDCADVRSTLAAADLPPRLRVGAAEIAVATGSLESLRTEHAGLSAVLEDVVRGLESSASQGDAAAESSLVILRPLLRRQLEREREMLGPGYAAGT